MSLLQDVLRQQLEVVEDAQRRAQLSPRSPASLTLLSPPDSDDDETIDVTSGAATPLRSRAVTPRSTSPTRSPPRKSIRPSPLAHASLLTVAGGGNDPRNRSLTSDPSSKRDEPRDPLRLLPDKVRPFIFCLLAAKDLAACSLVSQRWKKSQTINHAWYQLYRQDSYEEKALPVGKWTKRESKKDWRSMYLTARRIAAKEANPLLSYSKPRTPARSGTTTPYHTDGYLTPREMKEEEWKSEQETNPSKTELRTWYKEMGGKRVKKSKTGMSGGMGMRDRTAWGDDD